MPYPFKMKGFYNPQVLVFSIKHLSSNRLNGFRLAWYKCWHNDDEITRHEIQAQRSIPCFFRIDVCFRDVLSPLLEIQDTLQQVTWTT